MSESQPDKLRVDNSTLQCFKDCPKKCYLRYRRHLVPKDDTNRFKPEFGSAIHKGMEVWYKTKDAEKMDKAFIDYWAKYDGQDTANIRTMERGLVTLQKYRTMFLDEPMTVDPEMVEIKFDIDVGPFMFHGGVDLIAKWLDWEGAYICDHKTSTRKNSVCVRPNAQIEGYSYGAAAISGLKIKGAIFNFFTFRKGRAKEKIENTIDINRQMVDISEESIEQWKKDFLYWAHQLQHSEESNTWPRNTGMCFTYGRCPYLSICEMGGSLKNVDAMYNITPWEPWKEHKDA